MQTMKQHIRGINISILLVCSIYIQAQLPDCTDYDSQVTLKTPYGWNEIANIQSEVSSTDRETLDSYYINDLDYADADPVDWGEAYYSSSTFNCHGYVWHMTTVIDNEPDLNKRVWIENADGSLAYIEDNISYKEVDEEVYPGYVYWSSGSHSARTTDTPNWWRSKWGCGPLMEHDSLTHPYAKSGFRYFKRCYYKIKEYDYDEDKKVFACKHELENCTVDASVKLEIEYEDWLKITGEFSTGVGAELNFYAKDPL